MKLSEKIFLILGAISLIFLALSYSNVISINYQTVAIGIISLLLINYLMIKLLLLSRIIKLNQKIKTIDANRLTDPIKQTAQDELAEISDRINLLIQHNQQEQEELDQRVEKRTEELQKNNIRLQHELSTKQSTDNKLNNSREYLNHLAQYDNLTALPNRIFFNEILNKSLKHAKRHNKFLAILVIDLDGFKKINQDLGHVVGDYVIKEVGNRFSNVLRGEDILAKLDGDEFIVLLSDIGKPKFAGTVAEKLLKICSQPMKIDAHDFSVTASIGICIYPNDGDSLEVLLKNADIALHKAKSMNGNAYQFYTLEMDIEAHEYLQLEAALRKAIPNKELAVYYQPKLNLKNGTIVGVEALIRWTHPEFGIIPPAKFIPLAEETGIIMQIGEWSLKEACKTNKFWQDEGYEHISVSVNLSPKQFHHPNMAQVISNVLNDTGLNPKYLELEINEATVMNSIDTATSKLNEIKKLGVQIALDHFGTGYTSISHLKQFPINILKIDKSFIKGIPQKPDDLAITSAVIALAHNLGLEVVAEGVETAEQVQHLASQNCDLVQGYYLSHPLPAQKIVLQFRKLLDGILL